MWTLKPESAGGTREVPNRRFAIKENNDPAGQRRSCASWLFRRTGPSQCRTAAPPEPAPAPHVVGGRLFSRGGRWCFGARCRALRCVVCIFFLNFLNFHKLFLFKIKTKKFMKISHSFVPAFRSNKCRNVEQRMRW